MIGVKFLINNNLNNLLDYDEYQIVTKKCFETNMEMCKYEI